jgi:hypothetical protein
MGVGVSACLQYMRNFWEMGPVCRDWGHLAIEHDFRDKHASQFTTGRFVLLPKNLVTGAAKARIVSRATCSGRVPLEL